MSKRIFIDTNVMLDLLGERQPFYESIAKIASLGEKEVITLVVSPISYATVHYFISKSVSDWRANSARLSLTLSIFICIKDKPSTSISFSMTC